MSGCKHKGARKVQKSTQCIYSTECKSTPSKFLLYLEKVSVIYLCYFCWTLCICFAECELDCCIVLTMLTQTEQQTLWRHIESVHCCSNSFLVCWNIISIMFYMYQFMSLSTSFCSQWLSGSDCTVVLHNYCFNFFKRKMIINYLFLFMLCKKMITYVFFFCLC